jgi:hypothetical protein
MTPELRLLRGHKAARIAERCQRRLAEIPLEHPSRLRLLMLRARCARIVRGTSRRVSA